MQDGRRDGHQGLRNPLTPVRTRLQHEGVDDVGREVDAEADADDDDGASDGVDFQV